MKKLRAFLKTQRFLLFGIVFALLGFLLFTPFIEPAPPQKITIAAGEPGGTYAYFAQRYAEALQKQKITVEILYTQGSNDNLTRLQDPHHPVDVAFVQSGTAGVQPVDGSLRSIAAIYYEPLWVFYPKGKTIQQLRELKGRRLAVGVEGSGTRYFSEQLLAWNGVTPANSTLVSIPMNGLVEAFKKNEVDAIFVVGSANNPVIKALVQLPEVTLHSFNDAYAYVRKFSYLSSLLLPEGVMDMAQHLPERNVTLLAPAAMLVTHEDLNFNLVYLLLSAAKEINGRHGLLQDAGMFPTGKMVDLPLHKEAKRYFQSGPPFFQRFLPYPVAAFVDRTKILLLPILTLLFPLFKIAPPMYGWSIRRRIWRWYKALYVIENDLRHDQTPREELRQRLADIETKVLHQQVPLAYAAELYNLRQHIQLVRALLDKKD